MDGAKDVYEGSHSPSIRTTTATSYEPITSSDSCMGGDRAVLSKTAGFKNEFMYRIKAVLQLRL